MLPALEIQKAVQVEFRAILLYLNRRAGLTILADRDGRELAINGFHLNGLLLLSPRIAFIRGVGDARPASRNILGEERSAKQTGGDGETECKSHFHSIHPTERVLFHP